ncbi:MAG: DUF4431 domain-containing protein [Pseudomonadota bacterium]
MRAFLLAAALALQPLLAFADCLPFSASAHVSGQLVRETLPGPPNFESVEHGDSAEAYFVLRLHQPICVDGDPELGRHAEDVDEIQLVFENAGEFAAYRPLLGKAVVVDGIWMSAITAHHRTPRLLTHVVISRAN